MYVLPARQYVYRVEISYFPCAGETHHIIYNIPIVMI